jgi:hypothetical protein
MLTHRFNSTFRIKVKAEKYHLSKVWGMAAKRGLGIKPLARVRQPLNKVGPRTHDWLKAWRFLKPRLEAAERTRCEFGFIPHECYGRLDPCHSKKRRLMQGTDIYDVAIGCQNVHEILDNRMSHEEMFEAVMRAIDANGGPIRRAL